MEDNTPSVNRGQLENNVVEKAAAGRDRSRRAVCAFEAAARLLTTERAKMMGRQAYFYRVPPQEHHRRNQLQADPAKQTVVDMKVGRATLRVTVCRTGVRGDIRVVLFVD